MKNYIKKTGLNKVESFLNIKIKKNTISIGADTACYHTSFAIIRTTDDYLILESLEKIEVPKLRKVSTIKQTLDNVDLFTEQLDTLKNKLSKKYKFDYVKIEDCFYQFSVKTTKLLAYNGILTYDRLKRISDSALLIMPRSARAIVNFKASNTKLKGNQLKKEIIDYVNKALDLEIKNDDEADSIVLALAGIRNE